MTVLLVVTLTLGIMYALEVCAPATRHHPETGENAGESRLRPGEFFSGPGPLLLLGLGLPLTVAWHWAGLTLLATAVGMFGSAYAANRRRARYPMPHLSPPPRTSTPGPSGRKRQGQRPTE